jgi:phenolic acid decarboxylase
MNTYRVVGSNSQSKWVGDKATGRRVPLYKGKTVELTEAEAAELGPKRVPAAIRRLITAEKAGKNRDSVIKAATARLGELGKAK